MVEFTRVMPSDSNVSNFVLQLVGKTSSSIQDGDGETLLCHLLEAQQLEEKLPHVQFIRSSHTDR